MDNKTRILFGIPTKSHIEIAVDELYGLKQLGYICDQFEYGGKKNFKSAIARFFVILLNALKLLIKAYQFKPNFIYLNSRVEYIASARDFITLVFFKLFYYRKVQIMIKSHGSNLEVLQTEKFFFKRMVFPFLKRVVRAWLFLSSEELIWIVSNNLLSENKLFLSKNIVRVDKFRIDSGFREKFNIPADYKILLYVGRVIKEKGIHYVVDAFAEIREKHKVILFIVGDGEELVTIKNKIKELNIVKDVIITGWIDENKVTYIISNSDLLIFPTYAPEGFPMALFNSMAAGLSIVTTSIRAAKDYLEEPNNCLWVQPRSSASIKEGLAKILTDNNLMVTMRQNNQKKARLFDRDSVCNELNEIITLIKTK